MVSIKTYPKINLFLKIYPKDKEQSKHQVASVMLPFYGLYDLIKIKSARKFRLITNKKINNNILLTIINYFEKEYQLTFKQKIILKKRIPMGSGLGGASSNAMALIKYISEAYHLNLDQNQLATIGLKFGSDIPFFSADGIKKVSGFGEKLSPLLINNLKNILLITIPNLHISTHDTFAAFDNDSPDTPTYEISEDVFSLIKNGNDFLYLLLQNKKFATIYKQLSLIAPLYLSGSGPSLFGVNLTKEQIKTIKKHKGIKCYYCEY